MGLWYNNTVCGPQGMDRSMTEAKRAENSSGGPGIGKNEKRERLWSKDFVLLMISGFGINFLNYASLAVLSPFMILLTGRAVLGGVMLTAYAAAAIVARPVAGITSDKLGRMKLLIAGAVVLAATCFGLSATTALAVLIAVRVVSGMGYGVFSTCLGAAAADVLPKSRFAEGIGYFGLYGTLSQMVTPAIAIAIVAGGELADYRRLFLIMMLICGASAVISVGVSYERRRRRGQVSGFRSQVSGDGSCEGAGGREQGAEDAGTQVSGVRSQVSGNGGAEGLGLPRTFLGFELVVFAPAAVLIVYYLGYTSVLSFVTVYADMMDFGNSGIFFTFSAIGVLASRLIVGRVVDRYNADVIAIPALALAAVCLIALTSVDSTFMFRAIAIPFGLAQGALNPAINTILFKRCSPQRRGTASAAFFSGIDLGVAFGAPLLGAIADATSFNTMFRMGAVLCALALVIYILFASDRRYVARRR